MAEAVQANIGSKLVILLQRGPVDPKFQVEGVIPTNHSFSQKTRLNDLSYGVKIWTDFPPFCHNPQVWRTDIWMDTFLASRLPCIQCSAVKRTLKILKSQTLRHLCPPRNEILAAPLNMIILILQYSPGVVDCFAVQADKLRSRLITNCWFSVIMFFDKIFQYSWENVEVTLVNFQI